MKLKFIKTFTTIALGVVTILLIIFCSTIFKIENVYFYTSSTIVQGFIALVAFLGAVVVFKLQLENNALQTLSEKIEEPIVYYRGIVGRSYTPTEMLKEAKQILENNKGGSYYDIIEKTVKRMDATHNNIVEVRWSMVRFFRVSFLNVSIALISLLFSPVLAKYPSVGSVLLTANVYLSIFSFYKAGEVVRRTIGFVEKVEKI